MTEQERIEQLKTTVPRPQMTRGQKILEAIGWVCSVVAVIALVVGLVAVVQASDVSNCVNNILGNRNVVQGKDASAHVDFAVELKRVLGAPKDQQATEYRHFLQTLNAYVSTLESDQSYRHDHPLGEC